jgi:hypothetical protein
MKKIKKEALLDEKKLQQEDETVDSYEEAEKIVKDEMVKAIMAILYKAAPYKS